MSMSASEPIRILVVDDEEVVREPLTEALGWVGYSADGAGSVDEALEMLLRNEYDLLFCDLVMPGANGFTLMEVVRRQYPELAVIVLTGHATVELTQKAIHLGAQDFIIKPFSVRELPFIVERNMERLRLEAQLREQRTEHLLIQTIQALTAAIEAKDPYTAGHSQKVAHLALLFAQALGLNDTDVFVLRLAGLMHDVGKIGIPEGILLKPDKLNEREWEIMKQHPVIGAEIVGQIGDLDFVSKVVRSHHERWDGTGYPDGLQGQTIPLLSRILYLSDAYDALTADRSYRTGMSHSQALTIIKRLTGSHFDGELVQVLEEEVLPMLGPDRRIPDHVMPRLSRTTHQAMSMQQSSFLLEE
ncbi:MAG: HD-GYP domain-containing protein [Armatimonadota bacterium]